MSDELIFYGVGDVGPIREEPDSIFRYVAGDLASADLAFCQLEPVLSERGTPLPQAKVPARAQPDVARALKQAGFQVVSFATNHCMDYGQEAFQDTLDALREQHLDIIGAGENIEIARRPAIIEQKGMRIGFLAYNSILPQGFWAEKERPGCVPLRAHTVYEQIEHDQPGTPCRIITYAHRGDLEAMIQDIHDLRKQVDVLIVSMHWGIHFARAVLADYQREMAHAAIDAGADLILGHHAHILKGVEVYKGKAIFYSLGNFAIELPPEFKKTMSKSSAYTDIKSLNPDWNPARAFWPPDTYKTFLVKCIMRNKQIAQVSYLPAYIDVEDQPSLLASDDPRFTEVHRYVEAISREAQLDTRFIVRGNEVIIDT